ncbi:hypothetical protein BSKO_00702 [Bryopsis sp. KO-2023]|nr:hypothetical protein BSKO_00702 [Bryopsis sp. KO-2023]
MGCLLSKEIPRWAAYAIEGSRDDSTDASIIDRWDAKTKAVSAPKPVTIGARSGAKGAPKPADFILSHLSKETVIREQGSINGQQFIIDNCKDCCLYVLDSCDMVTIDDCKRCKIVIGPSSASVFIRDCSDCRVVALCQQFRVLQIGFGCSDLKYDGLEGQMHSAGLSPFHNFWGHIHDFTPKEGNMHFLPPAANFQRLIVPDQVAQDAMNLKHASEVLLQTWGERPQLEEPQAKLLRTNEALVPEGLAKEMIRLSGWDSKSVKEIPRGHCVGLEITGNGCIGGLCAIAQDKGALITTVEETAKLFRHLGIDG